MGEDRQHGVSFHAFDPFVRMRQSPHAPSRFLFADVQRRTTQPAPLASSCDNQLLFTYLFRLFVILPPLPAFHGRFRWRKSVLVSIDLNKLPNQQQRTTTDRNEPVQPNQNSTRARAREILGSATTTTRTWPGAPLPSSGFPLPMTAQAQVGAAFRLAQPASLFWWVWWGSLLVGLFVVLWWLLVLLRVYVDSSPGAAVVRLAGFFIVVPSGAFSECLRYFLLKNSSNSRQSTSLQMIEASANILQQD